MRGRAFAVVLLASWLGAQDPAPRPPFDELLEEGQRLALAHEWDQALAVLDRAVALAPDDAEALRWRGHAYTGAERYAEAFADLDRAVQLDGTDAWARYARAMALHNLGRYEEAIDGYTAALALDPSFFKAHEWRGYTHSLLGDHVRALHDIDAAIAVDGGNAWLRFIRAKAWVALLDFDAAEHDFWLVIDAEGTNADAHAQLGYLYACTGNDAAAVRMLRRAVELDPTGQLEARPWLFHLLAAGGDSEGATAQLAAITEAAAAAPDWTRRVVAFLHGEVGPNALVAAAQSVDGDADAMADEIAGRKCEAWTHIGLTRMRSGERQPALIAFAHAIGTDARDKWEWSWARGALRRMCRGE